MNISTILVLSLGLAMDATAVAAARGFHAQDLGVRHLVRVGVLFGGFQGLMPLLGWLLGASVGGAVAAWDHWIAFALLAAIGTKMLWEARSQPDAARPAKCGDELFATRVLLVLAVATSIDALAVGFTLPMLGAPMVWSLLSIALVTAGLSSAGALVGRRFGAALGRGFEVVGGLVLIGLGVQILLDHLDVL